MMVKNSKIELFMLEHPEYKDMIEFLMETPKNVIDCLEYSDWLYDNANALLVAGLIELHGDKVVEPLYRVFGNEMNDDIIDAIENAYLTSIHFIPESLISPRIISRYADAGLVRGIDNFVESESELLGYYRMAAKTVSLSSSNEFFSVWNKEDEVSREILTRRFCEQPLSSGCCKDVRNILLDYFKDNYELFSDFNSEMILRIARFDKELNGQIDTLKYFNIMMNCNKIYLSSSIWLMKRLLNRGYKDLFEKLVLKLDWSSEILYEYEYEEERIYKKIKKVLKKNKIKYIKYLC